MDGEEKLRECEFNHLLIKCLEEAILNFGESREEFWLL